MKKWINICLILLTTGTLQATSSISGPTGLVTIPTAEALRYKEFNIGYDYILDEENPDKDTWVYKLNIGTFQNIELGVVGGSDPTEGMFLNIKYYLTSGEERFPLQLAIGAQNLSSKDSSNIYMMSSKKIRQDIGIHFGFKAIFSDDDILPVLMGGTDFMFNEHIKVITDVNSDGEEYIWNSGIELFLTDTLAAKTTIIDLFSARDIDRTYSIGLSYNKFL